jgi:hypothetical protein
MRTKIERDAKRAALIPTDATLMIEILQKLKQL